MRPGVGAACAAHASSPEARALPVSRASSLGRFVPTATGTGSGGTAPSPVAALDDAMLAHARMRESRPVSAVGGRRGEKIDESMLSANSCLKKPVVWLFSLRVTGPPADFCVRVVLLAFAFVCFGRAPDDAGHRVARRVAFRPCDSPRDRAEAERPRPSP